VFPVTLFLNIVFSWGCLRCPEDAPFFGNDGARRLHAVTNEKQQKALAISDQYCQLSVANGDQCFCDTDVVDDQ
jgi:hypothetical protein